MKYLGFITKITCVDSTHVNKTQEFRDEKWIEHCSYEKGLILSLLNYKDYTFHIDSKHPIVGALENNCLIGGMSAKEWINNNKDLEYEYPDYYQDIMVTIGTIPDNLDASEYIKL